MIRARQEGRSEEAFIAEMQRAHMRDFAGFQIEFDNYGSTHSPENRELCGEFWAALRKAGLIVEKDVDAALRSGGRHVSGRPVRQGNVPQVQVARSVRRQLREVRLDLQPDRPDRSGQHAVSGAKPEIRSAPAPVRRAGEAARLPGRVDAVGRASAGGGRQLSARAIFSASRCATGTSRGPAPYFGFEIPDSPGNYWYVWFDAPIGYIASHVGVVQAHGEKLRRLVAKSTDVPEIHHFIGKDITYFHTLFWPGMLKTAGFSLPTKVHIHGFLTVGGEKMRKTQGHVRHGRDVPQASRPGVPALLLRQQARPAAGRPRPEPRRVRQQGQLRPGRQGREPRQPHGAVRASDRPVDDVSRRRRPVRPGRGGRARRSPRPTRAATTTGPCG